MLPKTLILLPLIALTGCHYFQRYSSNGGVCENDCESRWERRQACRCERRCRAVCECEDVQEECCAQAPAAAPQQTYSAPQQTPVYAAPQQQMYLAAQPQMMAVPTQQTTSTLGFAVARLPIPVLKFYSVPKPQQAQIVNVQQAPMMSAPMMAAPMMMPQMAPQMMAAPQAAPSCPSTDSANTALMMALIQNSQRNNPAQLPAVPSSDDAELESRAKQLEDRLDRLTKSLEASN